MLKRISNMTSLDNYSLLWIIVGFITFSYLIISKTRAPYGRHSKNGWGPMISNSWGWFWMELPALVVMPIVSIYNNSISSFAFLLITIWVTHYFNRVVIFPLRIKTRNKKMPLSIALSAFFFNLINGVINGIYVRLYTGDLDLNTYNVYIGLILFGLGMYINISSDNRLISLRKKSKGYKIPNGGLFKYISCPNHFGEIIEWFGYAVIAFSIPALSFALWTFFNLCPRSLNHHDWYRENFDKYPKNRKAVIPYIL